MTLKVHCPECRGQFQVDGEESRSRFECPFCSAPFRFQDKQTVVLASSPLTQVEVEPVDVAERVLGGAIPPPLPATPASIPPNPVTAPRTSEPTGSPPRFSSPAPENLTPLRAGDVLGGYRLEKLIGFGGMSVVFRAKQLSLGRDVAVKVMRRELGEDPEFSRRFLNEARALAELAHPNIVQVIDQGIHEGNHFLVMEFIDGVSLREVLSERRLTPAEALRLVPDLCSALEYAHERGIIHRDIKPENILVTRSGHPKIADFGLVRMLDTPGEEVSRLTQTRTVLGTVDYMAPEQRAGRSDVDHRADIYSLGVVLYEMLTGDLPVARFALPSEKVQVDVRIDDVVLKVLERDRDLRYQRASMVATDLKKLGDGSQVGARPGSCGLGVPATLFGRVAALAWFPVVLLFFAVASRDEDVAFAATGAALPLLALHLRSYGWFPGIPEAFRTRRWLAWGAAIGFFGLMKSGALENEAAALAIAFCVSTAIVLRRDLWRHDFSFSDPPLASRRLVRNGADPHRHPSVGVAAAPASRGMGGPGAAAPAYETFVSDACSPPQPPIVPSSFRPSEEETMPQVTPIVNAEPKKRTSLPLLVGFLLAIGTLVFSAVVSIPFFVAGDSWKSMMLNAPIEFSEVREFVGEVAPYSPETARPLVSIGRLTLFAPLAVPLLLSLLALPGLLGGRRRSPALFAAVIGLLGVQTALIATASGQVIDTVDQYCCEFEDANDSTEHLIASAETWPNAVGRLARLHRAAGMGSPIATDSNSTDKDAGSPLVRMAMDGRLSAQERKVSLVLLDRLFPELISDPKAFPSCPDWQRRFADLARPGAQVQRELKTGFIEVLSRIPSVELAELFGDLVHHGGRRDSLVALRWWTEVAPVEVFDRWVAELERSGGSWTFAQDVGRLRDWDGDGNDRVTRLDEVLSTQHQ